MPPPIVSKSIAVISGLGNGVGTGAATARAFSLAHGYRIALVSRPRKEIEDLKNEINAWGGQAEVFSLSDYNYSEIDGVFERIQKRWPDGRLAFALYNTGAWSMIPFLDIKPTDIQRSVDINIVAATAFSQAAIRLFLAPPSPTLADGQKSGGTLIFTGATSATRGARDFGAFAAGKHGARALSQSIAREFGPQGVHCSYVIIDGTIRTKRTLALFSDKEGMDKNWLHDSEQSMTGESIAKTYLFLHGQDPGAWTLEMDLRPAKEKF